MFGSDKWEKADSEIVRDCYGNRVAWGVLKALKARGYYNNRKAKAESTNGTYKTYGEEYSVENGADPNNYIDEV